MVNLCVFGSSAIIANRGKDGIFKAKNPNFGNFETRPNLFGIWVRRGKVEFRIINHPSPQADMWELVKGSHERPLGEQDDEVFEMSKHTIITVLHNLIDHPNIREAKELIATVLSP